MFFNLIKYVGNLVTTTGFFFKTVRNIETTRYRLSSFKAVLLDNEYLIIYNSIRVI